MVGHHARVPRAFNRRSEVGELSMTLKKRPLTAGLLFGPSIKRDRKSTRLNSSHSQISYAVFCLKKKKKKYHDGPQERHDRGNERASRATDLPPHSRTDAPQLDADATAIQSDSRGHTTSQNISLI